MIRHGQRQLTSQLDGVFLALSDPIRRAMLERLHQTEMTIGELGDPFPVGKPTITHHTRVLESAGLIRIRRDGRRRWCAISRDALHAASGWLEFFSAFWSESFDRLEETLDQGGREPNARLKR